MNIRIGPSFLGGGFLRPRKVVGCAIAIVVLIIVGVLSIGAALFFSYQRQQRLAKLTGDAPAQVLEVNVTGDKRNRSSKRYSTRIVYSFEVDGRTIEAQWTKNEDVSDQFQVGKRAKVCYDPTNPDDNEIFPPGYHCGK